MRMSNYHGALFLVLAMVMAMLSTGICAGTAPAPVPAPNSLGYLKPERRCWTVLSRSGCEPKACNGNCFIKLKGAGICLSGIAACFCSYPCKSPPRPA